MPEASLGLSIRRLRETQGLSLRTLADRTGFSASFLSQVENGQASPSFASMERIAAALGVTLGQFFQMKGEKSPTVIKADARLTIKSQWSRARIDNLGTDTPGGRLEPVLVTLNPGGSSGKRAYPAPREEFVLVLDGPVILTIGEEEQVLDSGDAVTIMAGVSRRWRNESSEAIRLLVVSVR